MSQAKRDQNRVTTLLAVSDVDSLTPIPVEADAATKALKVVIAAGGSSGTQYTEGDTDASITGTAMLGEGAANTLTPLQNTTTDGLLVNLGSNNDVTVTGTVTANAGTGTMAVSAASLPLPSGAATSANQSTIIGHVDGIEGLLTTIDADTGNLPTIETNTDFGTVTGGGTETGALRVTVANNSTGVLSVDDNGGSLTVDGSVSIGSALPAGTNAIGKLAANSGVDIGDVDVTSIAAGTNTIGDVGIKPRTSGGLTVYHLASAGSTNATNIKASAGQVFGWYIYNSNASARKVAFHNTSGTPTAGASVYFSLAIPPTSGANVFSDIGIPFSSGIAITTVTGLADSDSAAVAANDLIINIWYS